MKSKTQPSSVSTWDEWLHQSWANGANAMRDWLNGLPMEPAARQRAAFAAEQVIEAMHPGNYLASNPAALRRAIDTNGASLQSGMQLLLADVAKRRISNTDESAFAVGKNLATTPGKVVLRNELVELIQYAPLTAKVSSTPLMMVPPCINKFYILDLSDSNSFVRYAVEQGNTVFMVSWRNPGIEQGALTWDDYLQLGVVDCIHAVQAICKTEQLNLLGFCVGGTILAAALAILAARGEHPAASLTLLTTLLDFSDVGQLGLFVDPASVALREGALGEDGILPGHELASTFSFLRPRDLVWKYVTNGYLMGQSPPAFDLLYWNADGTNLPGPMYVWYLRNMYLENRLRSGELSCLGEPVVLQAVKAPTFVYASREDHIVPWKSAYSSTSLLGGECRFVLGASGHIAGVVNPPARQKRSYWSGSLYRGKRKLDADAWLTQANETSGSWWNAWTQWLNAHRGREIPARRKLGSAVYKPVADAPGEYVKVRI